MAGQCVCSIDWQKELVFKENLKILQKVMEEQTVYRTESKISLRRSSKLNLSYITGKDKVDR